MFMKRLIKVEKRRAAPAVQNLAIKKGQRHRHKSMSAARIRPPLGAARCGAATLAVRPCAPRSAVQGGAIAVHTFRRSKRRNSGAPIVKKNAKKEEQLALLFKFLHWVFGFLMWDLIEALVTP